MYFTRNVMVAFVNLTEETGEIVAERMYVNSKYWYETIGWNTYK